MNRFIGNTIFNNTSLGGRSITSERLDFNDMFIPIKVTLFNIFGLAVAVY